MVNNVPRPPTPVNEPVLGYLPGSPERLALKKELDRQSSEIIEIPCAFNGPPCKSPRAHEAWW